MAQHKQEFSLPKVLEKWSRPDMKFPVVWVYECVCGYKERRKG